MKKILFKAGLIDGLPIGLGYFAVSFSFGIAAVAAGIPPFQALLISMTNLTSAGQFAGIGIIADGGSYLEIALSQFVINLRYALMSIALSQKLDKTFKRIHTLILGHAVTDEIFAVAVSRSNPIRPVYFFGLATLPYLGWAGGTAAGAFFGALLPEDLRAALSVSIYGMFIAIVVPVAKKDKAVLTVVLVAVAISLGIYYIPVFDGITSGFSVIICAVIASTLGALLFPVKDGGKNE